MRLLILLGCSGLLLLNACSSENVTAPTAAPPPMNITGDWSGTYKGSNCGGTDGTWSARLVDIRGSISGPITISQPGLSGTGNTSGTYNNSTGDFMQGFATGTQGNFTWKGKVGGTVMSGDWTASNGCRGTYTGNLKT